MSKPIAPDYGTSFLLPPSLEDWISPRHPARFIREFVDALDLKELGLRVECASEGRPRYADGLLLKLWLYGYLNKIRSTRALERACHENVALIWLSGMLYPDHNTLWRFWSDNQVAVRRLFQQTVRMACQLGLVDLVLNAVDGTKIQAACSGRSGWSREEVERLLGELGPQIEQLEQQIQAEGVAAGASYQLPAELGDRKRLREAVLSVQAQLRQAGREHVHPQEPEARRMLCEGRNRFGYNAQAVADGKAGVVVAAEGYNQEHDKGLATPMLEQVRGNVGQGPEQAVADSGYGAAADLAQAQRAGFEFLAPPAQGSAKASDRYHASHFRHDEMRDVCLCPAGQELKLERVTVKADRGRVRIYRCGVADCPVRALCTRDPQGRMIELGEHHRWVQQQREKLAREAGRAVLRQRQVVIEPVFALIKERLGFRRWTVWGLAKVRTQWLWLCAVVNLMKIMKATAQTA